MELLPLFLIWSVAAIIYALPTIVAWNRRHPHLVPVALVNIFLGWTFVGWVVALVMASSAIIRPREPGPAIPDKLEPPELRTCPRPHCGARLSTVMNYCPQCGTRVGEAWAEPLHKPYPPHLKPVA